jgi:L-ascorbate metabolism protein UlaG (beta-lactamase superfamily)
VSASGPKLVALALVATTALFAASPSSSLSIRFIGNAGFELTDGDATILLDFPYQSGAFGYMTFDRSELRGREPSLCVFTHRHPDHFDAQSIATVGCKVAGPRDLLAALPEASRAGEGPVWGFAAAQVRCIPTEHAGIGHCSILIVWHGQRLYFAGDIEDLTGFDRVEGGLDVVFLPAWLASEATALRAKLPGVRIVIQHHKSGEVVSCSDCMVPEQGASVGSR